VTSGTECVLDIALPFGHCVNQKPFLAAVGHLFGGRIDGSGKELFRGKEIFSSQTVK
jgi:hypothetical protein